MSAYQLSDDLMVKKAHLGAMVYSPVDVNERPESPAPGTSYLVLDDDEICRLIAWWWCRDGQSEAGDDMIGFVIELVCDGRIKRETAAVMLRALSARAANDALVGWVMPEMER